MPMLVDNLHVVSWSQLLPIIEVLLLIMVM
jgi:hypothetical protein